MERSNRARQFEESKNNPYGGCSSLELPKGNGEGTAAQPRNRSRRQQRTLSRSNALELDKKEMEPYSNI